MLKRYQVESVDLSADSNNNCQSLYPNDNEVNHFCDRVTEYFANFNDIALNDKIALIEDFEHQLYAIRKFDAASISHACRKRLTLILDAFQKAHMTITNTNNIKIISINNND